MMRIAVRTFNDQPPAQPLAADFDEMGGTIGRSEGNTLILPDEKRYISRTQASVTFRAGSYVLRDQGSATPTLVNGKPLGNGNEVVLRGDEEIRIGDYVLGLSTESYAADPATQDPFADLIVPKAPAERPPQPPAQAPKTRFDPFDDPFATPPPRTSASAPAKAQPGVIPQDFDPFGDIAPAAPAAPPAPEPFPDLGLAPPASQNVDDLFGLKGGNSNWDPLAPDDPLVGGRDPLPGALSNDPLAGLTPPSRPSQQPVQRDDAPLLSGAFRPPQPVSPRPAPPVEAPPPVTQMDHRPPPPKEPPKDAILSWEQPPTGGAPPGVIQTVVLPSPKRQAPAVEPERPRPQVAPPVVPPAPQAAAAPRAPAPSAARAPAPESAPALSDGDRDALLKAFLAGIEMPDLKIPGGMTPEVMTLAGQITREAVKGTLDLLLARALTKREVRAQATVIIARENNPLKFSPTVEAALTHLFAPHGQGFMAPSGAVRDAYNDLRSHQFGFMAGMRAALEGVLVRFDPAHLEQRLAQKGLLAKVMPSSRRAKLWELYEQLYRDISREAEDNFHALFGKEFLRAYEEQIEKLEQDATAKKR